MNVDERLIQVRKDKQLLEEEEKRLLEEKRKSEVYIFQPGDVVDFCSYDYLRIIVMIGGKKYAVDKHGWQIAYENNNNFAGCNYKKIGVLSDYLK